jgi:hypothetical protein
MRQHGIPAWIAAWFGINANGERLTARARAAMLIIGSYFPARRRADGRSRSPNHGPVTSRHRDQSGGSMESRWRRVGRGIDSTQVFALFRDVVRGSSWPACGHLAAETALARHSDRGCCPTDESA